ncbi:MAG: pyridoxine 5'-phosphate synthase [Verrucomicrobia bacterium]|nr:MAG: pyridoxine 5'-phosphate synthase [Verrucomicrobiota bacterium]
MSGLRLGVNIDHVATLRQARYATMPESKNAEPDPVVAASVCERAGASGIVAHLRADRRHIQDRDIERLRQSIMTKLNLEMGNTKELQPSIKRLQLTGIRVSLFIDPTLEEVDAAAELGVEMVELHTGGLANAFTEKIEKEELEKLRAAARAASESQMQVNAGHGINYKNIALIHQIPNLTELNIGHSIVSRAVRVGLGNAVKEMLAAMENYRG